LHFGHSVFVVVVVVVERFIVNKVCAAGSKANYKIVPLTKCNKYLHSGKNEITVNILYITAVKRSK
jgi:hypothetical protein